VANSIHSGTKRESVVVGVLGTSDNLLVERLTENLVAEYELVANHLFLQADLPLRVWQSGPTRGYTWAALNIGVTPRSMKSSRDEAGAAGLVIDADCGITLHGDHLGLWPIYTTRRGDAVYFSNRLEPILSLVEKPTLDRLAWASLMSARYIPPGRSAVDQVATLHHGELLCVDPLTGDVRRYVDLPDLEPDREATFSSLADSVGQVLSSGGEIDIFLSGGLDSRPLGLRPSQWIERGLPLYRRW
jgi:hypothetical protein